MSTEFIKEDISTPTALSTAVGAAALSDDMTKIDIERLRAYLSSCGVLLEWKR